MEPEKYIDKNCKHHGLTSFIWDKKVYRCRKCGSERVNRNREKRKEHLVKLSGGQCVICGYNKCKQALEFHHINPIEKSFTLSSGNCKSLDKDLNEIKKCILVCANCHRELENGITTYSPVA